MTSDARTGAERIADERRRQVASKRYSAEHDDQEHDDGSLARAAACYASPDRIYVHRSNFDSHVFADPWPWGDSSDRRHIGIGGRIDPDVAARIRLLEKAGALIAAEIDRLLRTKEPR